MSESAITIHCLLSRNSLTRFIIPVFELLNAKSVADRTGACDFYTSTCIVLKVYKGYAISKFRNLKLDDNFEISVNFQIARNIYKTYTYTVLVLKVRHMHGVIHV